MTVHVEPSRSDALARRRSASIKAATSRKRRKVATEDLGPNSPLRGSAPVDGTISTILARIRAHQEGGAQ